MQNLQVIEQDGIRVLTSKQLAEEYGTTIDTIKVNFTRNRGRFIDGKHYISLTGDDLKLFKNKVTKCNLVGKTARVLYLWTEKGALLHAKSLNTGRAWEAYDYLVDFYFRAKESTEFVVRRKDLTPRKAELVMNPQELSVEDVRRMGMNRGIVLGVYRAENKYTGDDIMEVYNLLSDKGKKLV